jgi:pyrimidine-nucleoside phosphorylase
MITPVDVIARTRDKVPLTEAEIRYFISGIADGTVEHLQAAAWLMAVRLNGMSRQETVWLTQAMIDSGEVVDLSSLSGVPVDKHSTGGVGDTTTLILAPLVAAAGGKVAKMSGRGLGHTGGTLDKMEAAGLQVNLSSEAFLKQVDEIGVAVISQTAKLVPADGVLYSLRDVTATIDSVPLIASSVMSKKIACGAQAILLDVKYGDGAFMPCLDSGRELAQLMVEIGNGLGRRVKAALSSMEQPLGSAIGNALEFREACEVLTGSKADTPLARVSRSLAAELLVLSGIATNRESAHQRVGELLESGAAANKLKELMKAQGGNPDIVENPELLPQAPVLLDVQVRKRGFLKGLAARQLGLAGLKLGAGRLRKGDKIDPAVGLVMKRRVGERLEIGDVIATIHAANMESANEAAIEVLNAVATSDQEVQALPEIAEWVE